MIEISKLRALLAGATPGPWYARGRFLSRVPDNSGMGETLHTNHIGTTAEREDAALIAAIHEALPTLLDLADAALDYVEGLK